MKGENSNMVQEAEVRSVRKKLGLSQEKLAEKLGVTRNTISRWESGKVSPTADNLIALNRLLAQAEDPSAAEEAPTPKEETSPPPAAPAPTPAKRWPLALACTGFVCALLIGIASLVGIYSINQRLEPDYVVPAEEIEKKEVDTAPIVSGALQPLQP